MARERVIKHRLLSQAVLSISEGRAIDWTDAEGGAIDQRERQLLAALKVVAAAAMPVAEPLPEPGADSQGASDSRQELQPQLDDLGSDATSLEHWAHLDIRSKVAQGMFGEVYRAWDRTLGREVALKLLRTDSMAGAAIENTLGSFVLEEGRHLARVRHTNVITVYGAGNDAGRVGLWMEYIVGRTLEDLLVDQGRLGARQAALIGIDLCRALIAVHGAGLVHRDVKARNIMIEDGGRTVLMDFGAGQEMRPESASKASTIVGTPYYMAPEVLNGEQPSRRSDIYSLGVLLFRLVTREYPVEGASVSELCVVHEKRGATLLRDARPDLPEAFVRVVEKAMAWDPRQRFATAGQMEQALTEALGLEVRRGHREQPSSFLRRRLQRRTLVLIVLGLVLLLAVGTKLTSHGPASRGFGDVSGVAVCNAPEEQISPSLVSDGAGGILVVWQDARHGGWDLYAQRFAPSGQSMWDKNGVAFSPAGGSQLFRNRYDFGIPIASSLVSDGAGGAIVAWWDNRGDAPNYIYVQRITALGARAQSWPEDGQRVCSTIDYQLDPVIVTDDAGGAIVAWRDCRGNVPADVFVQHVDAGGNIAPGWSEVGVPLCTVLGDQKALALVADGMGGAIAVWADFRSGTPAINAQRVTGAGAIPPGWPADGLRLCVAVGIEEAPAAVSDGAGGAIVVWQDQRSSNFDIYAQHVTAAGTIASGWPVEGRPICEFAPHNQVVPTLVADGAGGAIICWSDWRNFCVSGRTCADIYAQRIDASAVVHWTANGLPVCNHPGDEYITVVIPDGEGGAIISWKDSRESTPPFSSMPGDIYAQRVDSAGVMLWTPNGVAVGAASGDQKGQQLVPDGAGGAFLVWEDRRTASTDIFANHVGADGVVGRAPVVRAAVAATAMR